MTLFHIFGESFKSLPSIISSRIIIIKLGLLRGLKKYQITNTLHLQMEDLKFFADFAKNFFQNTSSTLREDARRKECQQSAIFFELAVLVILEKTLA